ncbi:MAG: apolipoprotein N-acyltransferase [Bacillota bacterium]
MVGIIKNLFNNNKNFCLALLSGLLLITAFPPFELGFMAWIALLPLLVACMKSSSGKAFWVGFIFGLPFHLYTNYYLCHVLFPYLPTYLAFIALTALVGYLSLFYGLFTVFASYAYRSGATWFYSFSIPAAWLLIEYLRSLSFMAYNVGYIGYTQWDYPLLLNLASVYGYWGLPFLIVFSQVLLLAIILKKPKKPSAYLIIGSFTLLLGLGLLLPPLLPLREGEKPLQTALIQGNIHPEQLVERENAVDLYSVLTKKALQINPETELVVWPETVARINLATGKEHPRRIAELGEKHQIDFLYGARVRDNDILYNSITHLTAKQVDLPLYHKQRLVPFVEFFPMEELLNKLLNLDLLLGSYSSGNDIIIFNLRGIPVGGIICFESYFGDHARLFAVEGARHIFVLTNDAWFGESIGLEQHAQAAAIRAAETGVGVTQVANSGITISFDYQGKELFRSGKNQEAIYNLPLDFTTRETIYVRYGDYFPVFWIMFLLLATPASVLLREKALYDNDRRTGIS